MENRVTGKRRDGGSDFEVIGFDRVEFKASWVFFSWPSKKTFAIPVDMIAELTVHEGSMETAGAENDVPGLRMFLLGACVAISVLFAAIVLMEALQ